MAPGKRLLAILFPKGGGENDLFWHQFSGQSRLKEGLVCPGRCQPSALKKSRFFVLPSEPLYLPTGRGGSRYTKQAWTGGCRLPLPVTVFLLSIPPVLRRFKRPVQVVRSLAAQSGQAFPVYQRKEGFPNLPSGMLLLEQAAAHPIVPD